MTELNKDLVNLLADWYDSPLRFVRECIGVEPSSQQREALLLVETEVIPKTKRLSIKSGHGPGKDALLAWLILWFLSTRAYPKVPCTAPTARQLSSILWSEVSKWLRRSMVSDLFEIQKDKIYRIGAKDEWFASAITASVKASADDQAETLAGIHAEHVLVGVDEASGVPDPVYIPLEGIMTQEDNIVILISNPTKTSGYFYDTHNHPEIKKMWSRLTWNSEESTNVTKTFVDGYVAKYGRDSNIFRVRVLGEFPLLDSSAFIQYDLVESACTRDIEDQSSEPVTLSVDVGRGGDDTVILPRRGKLFMPYHIFSNKDTMETVREVAKLANSMKAVDIKVDVIGVGAGVVDRLKELGYPVTAVNVAESPAIHPSRYKKLRDELWGEALEYLEKRDCKIVDKSANTARAGELIGELTSVLLDEEATETLGKTVIESKKAMKARGLQSPNIADAFIMHFFLPVMTYQRELAFFNRFNTTAEAYYQPLDVEAGV